MKYSISCNSGTDALVMSLRACGIMSGDSVITTPFTYFATSEAISLVGAKPVFVDITLILFNINPKKIISAITKKTKAILSVNLFDMVCELDKINRIAREYNLYHIEDCANHLGQSTKVNNQDHMVIWGVLAFSHKKPRCFWRWWFNYSKK